MKPEQKLFAITYEELCRFERATFLQRLRLACLMELCIQKCLWRGWQAATFYDQPGYPARPSLRQYFQLITRGKIARC